MTWICDWCGRSYEAGDIHETPDGLLCDNCLGSYEPPEFPPEFKEAA
jgi:hypothetical protein